MVDIISLSSLLRKKREVSRPINIELLLRGYHEKAELRARELEARDWN
jgi:Ser/Thr protein kinase RdoA (MazF antagonist)